MTYPLREREYQRLWKYCTGQALFPYDLLFDGALGFHTTAMQIWDDESNNLTFKDPTAGTLTLSQLYTPGRHYIDFGFSEESYAP